MRSYTIIVGPGETHELTANGDYVRVKLAGVELQIHNPASGELFDAVQGDDFELSPFNQLNISHGSGVAQTIKLLVSKGKKSNVSPLAAAVTVSNPIALDAATLAALETITAVISGAVSISALTPTRGSGTNTQKTVTSASASMVAANANRNYLLIQNKDASGDIYIAFGGAATTANGVKIPAGGSYELNCNVLTAEIFAIGSIASNANIVVVEG